MSQRYLVDSNVLLRFLTGQPTAQAEAAKKLFEQAEQGDIVLDVSPVIVAEVFYVLTSVYKVDRKSAAEALIPLLRRRGITVRDRSQVLDGLERLRTMNVGFADAFLAAGGAEETVAVASFDRDLDKFGDVQRFEPKA